MPVSCYLIWLTQVEFGGSLNLQNSSVEPFLIIVGDLFCYFIWLVKLGAQDQLKLSKTGQLTLKHSFHQQSQISRLRQSGRNAHLTTEKTVDNTQIVLEVLAAEMPVNPVRTEVITCSCAKTNMDGNVYIL